jgi:hypothetical protein
MKAHLTQTNNRLKLTPELLYPVVLMPDAKNLSTSQGFAEHHHAFQLTTVGEEQQHTDSEGRTFCFDSLLRAIAPPLLGGQFNAPFVYRQFRPTLINLKNVVVLGMNQNLGKSPTPSTLLAAAETHTTNQRSTLAVRGESDLTITSGYFPFLPYYPDLAIVAPINTEFPKCCIRSARAHFA